MEVGCDMDPRDHPFSEHNCPIALKSCKLFLTVL